MDSDKIELPAVRTICLAPFKHRPSRSVLSLHTIFNYILQQLYVGCQWKELPIEKNREGHPEIHYTRVYCAFEDGKPMAVLTPFSPILYRPFIKQICSTRPSFMVMGRQPRRRKVRQHWVQRP